MASRRLSKSLPSPSTVSSLRRNHPPDPNPYPNPGHGVLPKPSSPPAPLLPFSLSPAPPSHLARFLRSYLKPSFTPADLLHLLRRRLRHHPGLAPYDLDVFLWASGVDSFRHDHSTYEWMVRTLAATGRLDPLHHLLRLLLSHPCPCADGIFACPRLESIFRFALNAFCRAGRLADAATALDDARRSLDGRPAAALYNILLHGFARWGEHQKALDLFDKMLKDRVRPDAFTFNILISSSFRNTDFDAALDWFREMRARGCEPNVVTFNTLIKGFFREKKIKEGIGVAREMLDLGCQFSVPTCEILMNGLCKERGRVQEASDLLMEFLQKGAIPEGFDCLVLVEALCKEGRVERALEVVNSLWERAKLVSVVTCTSLIEWLRNLGKINEAYELMEKMLQKEMLPDTITLNCLLEALCDAGRTVDANRLKVLASKKGFRPDGVTLGLLVKGFSREGRTREGERVVDEMLDRGFIRNIASYDRLTEELQSRNNSRTLQ
ncbi:pentatricopeptide repeat-containing protein [Cocos nucifera]|uniref:Pentatricopeptide repeat-containing protein n=1 Tax=Cocos nucifera TaxID=13894 RepID=A0A8K0I134_COCNU|nr:pentatricopeptide repeat-containing protein [Cocos nucifera]